MGVFKFTSTLGGGEKAPGRDHATNGRCMEIIYFFCCNTSCSDLIHWELSLFPISVDFLPLFGKDNTTSGLSRYRVNSNFTSEQLILRDSFPRRQLKANWGNKSPFFFLNHFFKCAYGGDWREPVCSSLVHLVPAKILLRAESLHQASPATACFEAGREVWGFLVSSFCRYAIGSADQC